jgi:DnaJ-class molecular chaperone
MKQLVKKPEKVALCRVCHGTGKVLGADYDEVRCLQCEGSGRVLVSCEMTLEIKPYRVRKQEL